MKTRTIKNGKVTYIRSVRIWHEGSKYFGTASYSPKAQGVITAKKTFKGNSAQDVGKKIFN